MHETVANSPTSRMCEPLLATASIGIYQRNAFRITGLAVDATTREVSKHADKLKMMEELGEGQSVHTGGFALVTPPSMDEIREAIQRLKDSEQRIVDELFWFWPRRFGEGPNDPAIQALARGDREGALAIWMAQEKDPNEAIVAMHNIAVLWHLVALEWEDYADTDEIDTARQKKIEVYWRDSFKRWEFLADHDDFWAAVSQRSQQLDGARLGAGFVRRMRATLPHALDKINAELAIRHAKHGRADLARLHVRFMKETCAGSDDVQKTARMVLEPVATAIKEQVKRVQVRTDFHAEDYLKCIHGLLEQTRRALGLYSIFFGSECEVRDDLSDEVAHCCHNAICAYQKATHHEQTALLIMQSAYSLAVRVDLRQLFEKSMATITNNVVSARLSPLYDTLDSIDDSSGSPSIKLLRVKKEVIPNIDAALHGENVTTKQANELLDRIASTLRGIAIAANNEFEDDATALEAIAFANDLVRDHELKARLAADKAQITKNKDEAARHNVLREIRGDTIEVTREKFRCNEQIIKSAEVSGIRYGIFIQYTNGVESNSSYLIAVAGARHEVATVECKRFFRSSAKAKNDFDAIVDGLFYHHASGLVSRLAKHIVSGGTGALGAWTMTRKGMHGPTGMLWWKKEEHIDWADVRFGTGNGSLTISSVREPKLKMNFSLMHTWNAVIFRPLINEIVTLLTGTPT